MLKFIGFLPLSLRHKIRAWALSFEHFTSKMVMDESILMLIENTDSPDFVEFDKKLEAMRKRWGIYDADLEGLAVVRRLVAFKKERAIK